MKKIYSYGIIPLKCIQGEYYAFVVQHRSNDSYHWGFPKGKQEGVESSKDTAERELKEETNFSVFQWIATDQSYRFHDSYDLVYSKIPYKKYIMYYPAYVSGEFIRQDDEISNGKWIKVVHLSELFIFDGLKMISEELIRLAENLDNERKY